jgi:hypothetical protein
MQKRSFLQYTFTPPGMSCLQHESESFFGTFLKQRFRGPAKTTNALPGEVSQVGACQLAQFRALVLKHLDQAGAFGLVRAELPLVPQKRVSVNVK